LRDECLNASWFEREDFDFKSLFLIRIPNQTQLSLVLFAQIYPPKYLVGRKMPSTSNQTEDGFCTFKEAKEVPTMSVAKEFTVLIEDRPSTLGKVCRALADREANILALQSFPIGGKA